jgi:hypothetical protein
MTMILKRRATRPVSAPNFVSAGAQNAQGAQSPDIPTKALDPPKAAQTAPASDGRAPALLANALPLSAVSALPPRPGLGDDPIIPPGGFASHEDAEKAFTHLLKKAGIDPTWTWDRTMRAIITDPLYKSLSTLAEKKAAWEKVGVLPIQSVRFTAEINFAVRVRNQTKRKRRTGCAPQQGATNIQGLARRESPCAPLLHISPCR